MGFNEYFSNMLQPGQWALFALLPPAIFALYFLKLRRRSVIVPSTYLWRRAIEDFRVNSLWQKLQQNLLLFLQILLVILLMLACLRPGWKGTAQSLGRTIYLVDTSASMASTDVLPNRLEYAKDAIDQRLDAMLPGEVAMLVSFAGRARVEQPFTTNIPLLRRRLAALTTTHFESDISEALQAAAGLANPGRVQSEAGDVEAAEPVPAEVVIYSDGRFSEDPDFSWGNLRPSYVRCGQPDAKNIGIVGFGAGPNPESTELMRAFAEVHNFTPNEQRTEVALGLNGTLLDAKQQTIPPNTSVNIEFEFASIEHGELTIELTPKDDFALDNRAFAVINPPRRTRLLVATPGNAPLQTVLKTSGSQALSEVQFISPEELSGPAYAKLVQQEGVDLILFDRCSPPQLPPAHTFFMGSVPSESGWKLGEKVTNPQIVDIDSSHPLLRFVMFGDVTIATARPLVGPSGSHILLEATEGPLAVISARGIWQDVVLGFPLLDVDEQGKEFANTDWPIRISFPLFFRNLVEYFAVSSGGQRAWIRPGKSVTLSSPTIDSALIVVAPDGSKQSLKTTELHADYNDTREVGIYRVFTENKAEALSDEFAVNLFDSRESNIIPTDEIATTWNKVAATPKTEMRRFDLWRWIVGLALILLVAEGILYCNRVA